MAKKENTDNRRTTERLMLARGYTWPTIKDSLSLSDHQYVDDRKAIEEARRKLLGQEDPREAYQSYHEIASQSIEDLETIRGTADSSAAATSAVRSKELIAANMIRVAQELGILPKAPERSEIVGLHNVNVAIEDKEELLRVITGRLSGQES